MYTCDHLSPKKIPHKEYLESILHLDAGIQHSHKRNRKVISAFLVETAGH